MRNKTIKGEDMNYRLQGYDLIETCSACPEQYDVLLDSEVVGYLRLRHGYFSASCGYNLETTVYESNTKGDGIFEDDERMFHLNQAVEAINKHNFRVYVN